MQNNQVQIINDPGSFKDPSGGVFYYNQKVYRSVVNDSAEFYQNFVDSEFFRELIDNELFVPSKSVDLYHDLKITEKFNGRRKYFEHERIEFISYPFEWSASMLIDAGIHTLDLQAKLLREKLSLKDATPYNIQYGGSKPLFIDLCSVERASTNGVWIAYNQFCQTFLYPLLMYEFGYGGFNNLFLSHMDGITLDETLEFLKFRPVRKHGLIIDYFLPSLLLKLKKNKILKLGNTPIPTSKSLDNSNLIQLHTVKRLRKALTKITQKQATGVWINYTRSCSYNNDEYEIKKEFIDSFLSTHKPHKVLDLGCNVGDFSIIASKHDCEVVAIDSDHDCIDFLFNTSKESNYKILPLCVDIANPSPAIGWYNEERPGFIERMSGKFDCVFALALIHHLIITNRIPLIEVCRLLHNLTSDFLVIEYVGREDEKFKELLFNRKEDHTELTIDNFEKAAKEFFTIKKKAEVTNKEKSLERCIYLMKKLT
jgi:SAM-dependent methyltransferase